ncbi:MAG: MFS transporter [Bacteroidota bacterium]
MKKDTLWKKEFVLLAIANLFMSVAFYFIIPTLPIYIETILHEGRSTIGFVLASYSIAALLIRPFIGMALDRWGRKTIYLGSFLVFALLFNIYALTAGVLFLVVLRFMHGLTWGTISTASSTVVVDIIPPERRGEGIGIFGLSTTVGMAVGPALGLLITHSFSYSAMFIGGGALAISGFILSLFVKYPKYVPPAVKSGVSMKNLFERRSFPASLSIFVIMLTYGGLLSFVAIYGKQIGIQNPGTFFIIYALGLGISRFFAGRIFDRTGPKTLSIAGLLSLMAGFLVLALEQNHWGFLTAGLFMGMGVGIIFPTFQALVNNMVPPERRGAANSTFFTAVDLGIGLGMIIMGILADAISISNAFLVSFVVIFVGLIITIYHMVPHYERHKIASGTKEPA